jgi:hypothetical protein
MSENKLLTTFLHGLIKDIDSGTLPEEKLRRISEFLFSYKFHESLELTASEEYANGEEIAKYAYLGWYIYHLTDESPGV